MKVYFASPWFCKAQEEREQALLEVEDYKKKTEYELDKRADMLEAYR